MVLPKRARVLVCIKKARKSYYRYHGKGGARRQREGGGRPSARSSRQSSGVYALLRVGVKENGVLQYLCPIKKNLLKYIQQIAPLGEGNYITKGKGGGEKDSPEGTFASLAKGIRSKYGDLFDRKG